MTAEPASLATALPAEIERVSKLRDRYVAMRGMAGVNVEPVIHMMGNDIRYATEAAAAGDTVKMVRCLAVLRDYTE